MLTRSQWKSQVRERGACERCGRTERLHAHHIDEDRENNTLENGECLCVWCHDDHHGRGGSLVAWDEVTRNPSAETRRKMSEAGAGQPGTGRAAKGVPHTDEHKARISAGLRGHAASDNVRAAAKRVGEANRKKGR